MIDLLKTVYGAVATKDIVPVLTNFCLYRSLFNQKGRIQGSNGVLCIDAPFEHQIPECTVKASKFIKAVEACKGFPEFGITPTGKLSVKNGKFKAYLQTLPHGEYPVLSQEGTVVRVKPNLLTCLDRIKTFISEDASRTWSMSVLISNGFMYATNNIIVVRVRYELDYEYDIALPSDTVKQMLEINELPSSCYLAETSVTFEYGDMWLRSQLTQGQWPTIARLFEEFNVNIPIPTELKTAVDTVKDFCANEKFPIVNLGDCVETDSKDEGASIEGFSLPASSFHADQLMKVLSVATHADFSKYPAGCPFKGDGIEGLFVGVAKQ